MKNILLIFLVFLFSCVDGINTTSEVTMGDPDIRTKILVPFNGIFNLNQTKDITVAVQNVGTGDTNEPVMVLFPSMYGYTVTFDTAQTTANNPAALLGNRDFTVLPFGGNLLVSTNEVIPAGKALNLGFKITADKSGVNQIVNISALPYTGGETIITNNVARINIVSL